MERKDRKFAEAEKMLTENWDQIYDDLYKEEQSIVKAYSELPCTVQNATALIDYVNVFDILVMAFEWIYDDVSWIMDEPTEEETEDFTKVFLYFELLADDIGAYDLIEGATKMLKDAYGGYLNFDDDYEYDEMRDDLSQWIMDKVNKHWKETTV